MRALVYTGPKRLELLDVPEPEPEPGDVIVQVEAVGICGSDLEGFASQSPFRKPPLIMGHEAAGVRLDTGDRVVINPCISCWNCDLCLRGLPNVCRNRAIVGIQRPGAFAERVAVPERSCYRLPDQLPASKASMVEPMANAAHAVRLIQEHEPVLERVAIIGAGMLGIAVAIQARERGAHHVQVAERSELRRGTALAVGANEVVEALDGEFDAVFDAVGSAETRRLAMEHLRPGGTCVWIGLHEPTSGFDGLDLIRTEKRVLGTFCYHDQDYHAAIRSLTSISADDWLRERPLDDAVATFYGLLDDLPAEIKTVLVP